MVARNGRRADREAAVRDAVPERYQCPAGQPHDGGTLAPGRLVSRPVTALRPHAAYLELCGPIAATDVRRVGYQAAVMHDPLVTTRDGTILDGHVRWQVAMDREWPCLPCLECDLTEEEALHVVIERHRTAKGLNAFCRILLALRLEPYFRTSAGRRPPDAGTTGRLSNLTNGSGKDVRVDIARVAGVSTGNVTKVKQLLGSVVPEVRERLVQGEVRIHRAWQWRTLSPKAQRDALWEHFHQGAIKTTVRRLVKAHANVGAAARPPDVTATVLGGLTRLDAEDITVAVLDVPGRAVVVTRACFDELQEQHTR